MAPATGTALVLLVAFVLPGFVVVLFQEHTFKQAEELNPFDRLLRALYYSVWCYLLLAGVALVFNIDRVDVQELHRQYQGDPAELVWRGTLVVLVPATVVWLSTLVFRESGAAERLAELVRLNARHQQPTAWDFWFRQGLKSHVRVIYADGRSVWGYYGDNSFASYAKDGLDLFLEHIYREREVPERDESDEAPGPWFGQAHARNRGGWVKVDDAVCVEIYDFDDAQEAATAATESASDRSAGTSGSAAADQPSPGAAQPGADAAASPEEGLTER